ERPRQRLAPRNAFPHLVLREPLLLSDQLALHLADEGDRTAEAEQPKPKEIPHEIADRYAAGCFGLHRILPASDTSRSVTLDVSGINSYRTRCMRWLTLLTTLPPTPTRHRVGVWRKLQRMGAVRLRGAGWILPENPEATALFQWLVREIHSVRGEATLLRVDRREPITAQAIGRLLP